MTTRNTRHLTMLAAVLFAGALGVFSPCETLAADDEAVGMIVELINGSDSDMRMMAIGQIREAAPGKDATKRFVELLASLKGDTRIKLIDALGARGDATARPAILKLLDSKDPGVRTAAAEALSGLAGPADIPPLAKAAATGSDAERKAARRSLRQLRGKEIDAAMIAALKGAGAKVKIELIAALTDRNAAAAADEILKSADDPDMALRLAVLDALRAMADENHAAPIVKRLKTAKDKSEVRKAALALLFTCRRGKTKCAEAVIAGFKGADPTIRILLMRALTEAGGPKSLNEIVARMTDEDTAVSTQAVRVLTAWDDPQARVHLKKLARDVKNTRNHVLAMRGLVRLASATKDRQGDLGELREAMTLATRKEERILVLSALGAIPTAESLALVAAALDQPALAEDAGLAAVLIAEKIAAPDKAKLQTVIQKVAQTVKNPKTQDRAKKLIEGL